MKIAYSINITTILCISLQRVSRKRCTKAQRVATIWSYQMIRFDVRTWLTDCLNRGIESVFARGAPKPDPFASSHCVDRYYHFLHRQFAPKTLNLFFNQMIIWI